MAQTPVPEPPDPDLLPVPAPPQPAEPPAPAPAVEAPPVQVPQPFQVDVIPDVWGVIAALGGVGTAIGAIWAVWVAIRTLQHQVENQRTGHAANVTIFTEGGSITVENLGELPVYDVALAIREPGTGTRVLDRRARLSKQEPLTVFVADDRELADMPIWVAFTDPGGLRWSRQLDGTLKYKRGNERAEGAG